MNVEFSGEIWFWHVPHFFVTVPARQCDDLRLIASLVTYGWGMIPAGFVGSAPPNGRRPCFPKTANYMVRSKRVCPHDRAPQRGR